MWNKEQIQNLKDRQARMDMHPYTCECGENLIPTEKGWRCGKCSYTQNWAHGTDLCGEFKEWPDPIGDALRND